MKKFRKSFLISFMLMIITNCLHAQQPEWQWAQSAGGIASDRGNSIVADARGNIYVAGTFSSMFLGFGNDTVYHHTRGAEHKYDTDIFLVKYNTNGEVIWALSAGGKGTDGCRDIAVDSTGNLYMTGYFSSLTLLLGDTTLNSSFSNGTAFTAKFDPNGKILWGAIPAFAGQSMGFSITVDSVGNSYSTGFFSGQITFGDSVIKSKGVFDTFLVKCGIL